MFFLFLRFGVRSADFLLMFVAGLWYFFSFRRRSIAKLSSLDRVPTRGINFEDFCVTTSTVAFLFLEKFSSFHPSKYIVRIVRIWLLISCCVGGLKTP